MMPKTQRHIYSIYSQPDINGDLSEAIISWQESDGDPIVISRFKDRVWIGAPIGSLANSTEKSRTIDFSVLKSAWEHFAKCALYCALRHPFRINKPPSFATLLKKAQALFKYISFLENAGCTAPEQATEDHTKRFFIEVCIKSKHPETLVSHIGTLTEVKAHAEQGLLKCGIPFHSSRRGAVSMAKALWAEHRKGENDEWRFGHAPFDDVDTQLVIRAALFYIDTLSKSILSATEIINSTAAQYPQRKYNRSEEGKCRRAIQKDLSSQPWESPDCKYKNWPPKNSRQLFGHLRLLSAACAIIILFLIGCRRSEFLSLKVSCIKDSGENATISVIYYKGEDDFNSGRPVDLAASRDVLNAVAVQRRIKTLIISNALSANEKISAHDRLFVSHGARADLKTAGRKPAAASREAAKMRSIRNLASTMNESSAQSPKADDDSEYLQGAPLKDLALNACLRDFGTVITPEIEGRIAPHRLRKTIGRLITSTMEGATLVLQAILGHEAYTTTLRYMFSSPFIQDEILESFPELLVRNLEQLYKSRDDLGGGGGRNMLQSFKEFDAHLAGALLGDEVGMSEHEFVELSLELMNRGHMLLTVLGPGIYCLKPPLARGVCNQGRVDSMPNLGSCSCNCQYNVQTKERRPYIKNTIIWLQERINDSSCSKAMQRFYGAALKDQESIFPNEVPW